jgi:hypothetical protein
VWREARGPDENGIGFKERKNEGRGTGLSRWKSLTSGKKPQKKMTATPSTAAASSASAPAAKDAAEGLKAMLGVSQRSPPPTTDTSASLKAMLGVQPATSSPQQAPTMHQPFPPPPPPPSAADKLMHMMQQRGAAQPGFAHPPPTQSPFNFTYVNEGEPSPAHQQAQYSQPAFHYGQQQMPHPPQPPPVMVGVPVPSPFMTAHQPAPRHGSAPKFAPPEEDFPALGANPKEAAPKAKEEPQASAKPEITGFIVPSVVVSKTKKQAMG